MLKDFPVIDMKLRNQKVTLNFSIFALLKRTQWQTGIAILGQLGKDATGSHIKNVEESYQLPYVSLVQLQWQQLPHVGLVQLQ